MARPAKDEQGFILIGAIWLLILCGSIAAILTLRAVNGARAAGTAERTLKDDLLLDAALETILADILFNGPRSKWALLPADGSISGPNSSVSVRVTSDLGRIDVNHADPELLGRLFQGHGLDDRQRDDILAKLALRRAAKRPISTWAELHPIIGGSDATERGRACLLDHLTLFSGRPVPHQASMPTPIAHLVGAPATPGRPAGAPLSAGTPLRIELTLPSGPALTAWVRLTGLLRQPFATAAFQRLPVCATRHSNSVPLLPE